MPRVVHFEIASDDPEQAGRFYGEVFGWAINKWDGPMPYWLVDTGASDQPGINGGIFKRMGPVGTVNSIDVPSVDDYVARVTAAGGELAMPKMAIPGVGYLAYCKDPEGNLFGLHQSDATAGTAGPA